MMCGCSVGGRCGGGGGVEQTCPVRRPPPALTPHQSSFTIIIPTRLSGHTLASVRQTGGVKMRISECTAGSAEADLCVEMWSVVWGLWGRPGQESWWRAAGPPVSATKTTQQLH